MNSVLCLMKYHLDPQEAPPFPKFDYQMEALKNLGWDVAFLGVQKGKIYLCNAQGKRELTRIPLYRTPGIGRITLFNALFRAVIRLARESSYTLAYIRIMPAIFPMRRALTALKKNGTKLVMEIPTFPPEQEEQTEKRIHRRLFFALSRRYETAAMQELDLFTLIGRITADSYRGVPAINITNGISLSQIPQRVFTPLDEHIRLLAVANIQVMNAFDRVIEGIRIYQEGKRDRDPDIHFHIIGPDRDGTKTKLEHIVRTTGMDQFIHFEGPLFGQDLESFFAYCDIAVGSMGLHRIGHTGIATLKAREYLAHGIPYITSGVDPVIPQDRGWNMIFAQDDSPIDMRQVIGFIETVRGRANIGNEMRSFVQEQLTWERQFESLFKALTLDYNANYE